MDATLFNVSAQTLVLYSKYWTGTDKEKKSQRKFMCKHGKPVYVPGLCKVMVIHEVNA